MKLKVKRIDPRAAMPFKTHASDVGLDLISIDMRIVEEGGEFGFVEYKTGLSVECEEGYHCEIWPRSSICNTGLWLANSIGLIDPEYRGELLVRFKWIPRTRKYEIGERVAQLVVVRNVEVEVEEVRELSETERAEAGFGSTGR